MATIVSQKNLIVNLKKETSLNIGLLSKLQPMSAELSRLIFKENALEKPTQTLFNQLSYYLVSIIDPRICNSFTWPLYDTKAERAYRNELFKFISDYSKKGLNQVPASYLVNPACYKITVLLFQLTQLAVNRELVSKMVKDSQKKLYETMMYKYKTQSKEMFMEFVNKETEIMLSKFSNYLCKRKIMENIAALFRKKILDMEAKLASTNAQGYINEIVDNFILKNNLDDASKALILQIKDVNHKTSFFDDWLLEVDNKLNDIEKKWDAKMLPLLKSCNNTYNYTDLLLKRYTGETERSSYTVEYNPKEDRICTDELQNHVNSHQKFILKNLETDGKLNFPNLIRAFVIAMSFILKNNEFDEDIFKFNSHLEAGQRNYSEIVSALKILIERVSNAEARLQPSPRPIKESISIKGYPEIPPLPELSDLKMNCEEHKVVYDAFTPLSLTKHQFNLLRKSRVFAKPNAMAMAPMFQAPKDDLLKTLISCRISSYDRSNTSNVHNMSVIANVKANETIAECASGFTKQQILRLLSTKKTSSSKKQKYSQERPNIKIKKGGLFNDSNLSNDSNGLFRSYSSPNLFENREKKSVCMGRGRKLSIMQENSPPQFEMSGIACLDANSNNTSPMGFINVESSRKDSDLSSLPAIHVTNEAEMKINHILEVEINNLNNDVVSPILYVSNNAEIEAPRLETPKANVQLVKKTSSLEKIINRFKKVRASVMQKNDDSNEILTILEEKENNGNTVNAANRILLPDLLSPSCSLMEVKPTNNVNYLDQWCKEIEKTDYKRPRESLGTALGVDQTFLDQFDLID